MRLPVLPSLLAGIGLILAGAGASAQTQPPGVTILASFGKAGVDATPLGGVAHTSDGRMFVFTQPGTHPIEDGGSIVGIPAGGGLPQTLYRLAADDPDGVIAGPPLRVGDALYGATAGNSYVGDACGEVFRFDRASGFQVIHRFEKDNRQPCSPLGGLTLGPDGKLYGVTQYFDHRVSFQQPQRWSGVLYRMTLAGQTEILHRFTADEGVRVRDLVTVLADGTVVGVAEQGGPSGGGTVWSVAPDGSTRVLKAFATRDANGFYPDEDGAAPLFGVTAGADGWLYGVAPLGGIGSAGTLWRVARDGSGFTVLHHFAWGDPADGLEPFGPVLVGSDGRLYGVTEWGGAYSSTNQNRSSGGGTVWSCNPDGSDFRLTASFGQRPREQRLAPIGSLFEDVDGNLVGASSYGGDGRQGTVYRVAR